MTKREFFENELRMKPSEIGAAVPFNPNGETEVTEEWLISFIKNLLSERSNWHTDRRQENEHGISKPMSCPFCGGEAKVVGGSKITPVLDSNGAYVDADIDEGWGYGIECKSCHASIYEPWLSEDSEEVKKYDGDIDEATYQSAVTKWNARQSPWHTGTPTENGYYLCKVFYDKDTSNDMRILEWVSSLDCFCIPYSEFRAYHYYVGENNGEDVEVVYEWQKLDMRFRMETKWIEPNKEKGNGS